MSLVPLLLRLRENAGVQRAERVLRRLPPVDRAAKRLYAAHKRRALEDVTRSDELRRAFLGRAPLPDGFGRGMDERIVEYPWVLSRIPEGDGPILDAGSTLNFPWVARHPAVAGRPVVLYTLSPEGTLDSHHYSYVYGDLRSTLLRDDAMSAVVCLSTLEHIGMDNRAYTGRAADRDHDPAAYRDALRELRRVLAPGAPLLLTVPFGQRQDVGWLQQFDRRGVRDIIDTFQGDVIAEDYFRHDPAGGWRRVAPEDCADARFVYRTIDGRGIETRATAVACLALRKPARPA